MPTRVLVVDDSPTIRKVVSTLLERHGYEAVAAADGQAALEILDDTERGGAGPFDIVLVDFVMPRMNGFQFCRALRSREALRATPVILMSAKSDKIREQFVNQTGAIDAITKPFDATALVAVIENAVKRSVTWRARGEAILAGIPDDFEPSSVGRPPPPQEAGIGLSGDIAIIPIGAILQLLQIKNQTGVLTVFGEKTEVAIVLRRGLIDLVQSRGTGQEFRLGRYFVELGLVTPEQIDSILRRAASPSGSNPAIGKGNGDAAGFSRNEESTTTRATRLLGNLLVESGKVSKAQLDAGLARQSSELVYEVLRWQSGRFEFRRERPTPLAESARLGLPVAQVVMEGFRRVDEWRQVETGLGSFDAVLQRDTVAIDTLGEGRLARAERTVLEAIDGERTVREIISACHMSSFDVCKILFQLLEARLVRRRAT